LSVEALRLVKRRNTSLPLPAGEGWGEGEASHSQAQRLPANSIGNLVPNGYSDARARQSMQRNFLRLPSELFGLALLLAGLVADAAVGHERPAPAAGQEWWSFQPLRHQPA